MAQMTDDVSTWPPPRAERLTPAEAMAYRDRLAVWNDFRTADSLMKAISGPAGFYAVSQGGLKFWREMYSGMTLMLLTHADHIRLGDDPPDVVLRHGERETPLEIVTAMPVGRRIGDEFNALADAWNSGADELPPEHFDPEADYRTLVADVLRVTQLKMSKEYPKDTVLVVAIQHYLFDPLHPEYERAMVKVARDALAKFREVWLLKGSWMLRVSPQRVSRVSEPWTRGE